MQSKTKGEDTFLPVVLKTAENVPYMAFIDLAVFLKHVYNRYSIGIKP